MTRRVLLLLFVLLLIPLFPGVSQWIPQASERADEANWELWSIPIEGGPVCRLTNDLRQQAHPRVSPDGRWLLFEQRDCGGKAPVPVLRNMAGQVERELTELASVEFTPDSRLLFTEVRRDATGASETWFGVMACNGAGKRLYRQGDTPVMSPDGRKIAFSDARNHTLLISAEGKSEAVLLGAGTPTIFNRDGTMLAVSRRYRMERGEFTFPAVFVLAGNDAGKAYELPEANRRNNENCWGFLPNNTLLCTRYGEGVFLADPQRSTLRWVTRDDDWAPEITPDGAAIVFIRLRGMWGQICRVDLDGSHFRPITSGLVDTPNFTLHPDGKTVFFSAIPRQGYDAATLVTRTPLVIAPLLPAVQWRGDDGMIPLRYLAEQLGAEVGWDAVRRRVVVAWQGNEYIANLPDKAGRSTAVMAGETLFVPAREFIEALGGTVWGKTASGALPFSLPALARRFVLPLSLPAGLAPSSSLFFFSLDGATRKTVDFNTQAASAVPLTSPDGQWLIMSGERRRGFTGPWFAMPENRGITIRRVDSESERRLLPPLADGSGYDDFTFSPDGRTLLFSRMMLERAPINEGVRQGVRISYRYKLAAITLADGAVREFGVGSQGVFSPDGRQIAFTREDAVWVIGADGTGARRVCAGFAPRFTPDGVGLLVQVTREGMTPDERAAGINASLVLCPLADGEPRVLGRGTPAGFSVDGTTLYAWEARVQPPDLTRALALGAGERVEYIALRSYPIDDTITGKAVFTGAFHEVAIGRTHVAGISTMKGDGGEELQAAPLAGGQTRLLARGSIRSLRFTPDGRFLLFIKDNDLYLVNANGGDIAQVSWGVAVDDYALTADGSHLLVVGRMRN